MAGDPLAARLAEIAVAPDADRHRLRQRCVETFATDAKYRNDERFARVWLALAAASPDPGRLPERWRGIEWERVALVWSRGPSWPRRRRNLRTPTCVRARAGDECKAEGAAGEAAARVRKAHAAPLVE